MKVQVEQLIRENFPGERNKAFRLRIREAADRGAEAVMMLARAVWHRLRRIRLLRATLPVAPTFGHV